MFRESALSSAARFPGLLLGLSLLALLLRGHATLPCDSTDEDGEMNASGVGARCQSTGGRQFAVRTSKRDRESEREIRHSARDQPSAIR
jgi:hypothetical protein